MLSGLFNVGQTALNAAQAWISVTGSNIANADTPGYTARDFDFASALRETFPDIPVIGIEPGVKPAAQLTKSGVVGVLATTRTLHSDRFQRLVGNQASEASILFLKPPQTPGLGPPQGPRTCCATCRTSPS